MNGVDAVAYISRYCNLRQVSVGGRFVIVCLSQMLPRQSRKFSASCDVLWIWIMSRIVCLTFLVLFFASQCRTTEAQAPNLSVDRVPGPWQLNLKLKHTNEIVNKSANALVMPAFDFKTVVFESKEAFANRARRTPSEALEAGMKFDEIEFRTRVRSRLSNSDIDWRHDYRNNRPSTRLP